MKKQSMKEIDWQAQDDARTMANYQEIINDKARMRRAIKEATKQANDLDRRAKAMKDAISVKPSKSSGRRG